MNLKALPKNTFLKKFTKLTFVCNFTVNDLFPTSNKLVKGPLRNRLTEVRENNF